MTDGWSAGDITRDAFLGGHLTLCQPRRGYRAGIDPVLLAAAVPAGPGDSVLDLGCGAGAAALCLGARVPGLTLMGLERHRAYADLARRNADSNDIAFTVVTGDVAQMPDALRQRQFSHVIANPPYHDRSNGSVAPDPAREAALGEDLPLAGWLAAAARRTAPGGHVTVIQRASRLPDLLAAAAPHLGALEVLPLVPREGRPARLVLLRGRRGKSGDFRLHHGWVLHRGPAHPGDRENYTTATACVLRHAAALAFPV